jgi:hypothetical protein
MPDDFTRLTWLLLPLIVCKEGRAVDLPQWIAAKLYPARVDVDASMIAAALDWFAARDMIRRYTVNGRHYFYLTNFHKHQGDTGREADSPYPAPDDCNEPVLDNSRVTHEQVTTNSRSMQSNSNSNSNSNAVAVATASANGASAEDVAAAVHPRLKAIGLGTNAKTLALLELPHFDDDYAAAMVAWAQRAGKETGLAIKKIEDGDPVPGSRPVDLTRQIPADLADIIQR